jgi:putative ABC transport system permease protein
VPTEPNQAPEWHEVIGVVGDVNPVLNDARAQPTMYVSVLQHWRGNASHLVVRGVGDRSELVRQVKQAVVGADTFAEVTSVRTLEQAAGELLYPRRIAAGTLAGAGLVGLALASVGLYGVVSFSVSQRLRELGIRTTLGAGRRDIMLLVLKEGATVAVIGCAVGFALAITALRFTVGLIPGLPLVDGVAFVVVPVILAVVVLTACYLPARRAARVNPIEVLRGH